MVIVDTTVWIDDLGGAQNREANWLNLDLGRQRLGLTDLNLCEVLQGIRDDRSFARVRRQLGKFELFETGGSELAVAAAQNFRRLRRRGHTGPKTSDCLIATLCLRGGHSLLHRDRDFDPLELLLGSPVIHP
jgi:predicted nucleic acid-binding protein